MPNRPRLRKFWFIFSSLVVLGLLLIGGVSLAGRDLAKRWPEVSARFPESLLRALVDDAELKAKVHAQEKRTLDSLRATTRLLPDSLFVGDRALSMTTNGDSLQVMLELSPSWGARLDSFPVLPSRLASRPADSLDALLTELAKGLRPSRTDRVLASAFLALDWLTRGFVTPSDEMLMDRMLQARNLRERFWPGRWQEMQAIHFQRETRGMLREAHCWMALGWLSKSMGVPDSSLGPIHSHARIHGLGWALGMAQPKDPHWFALQRELARYQGLERDTGEGLPRAFPGKVALESDSGLGLRIHRRFERLGYPVPAPDSLGHGTLAMTGAFLERFQENRPLRVTGKWNDSTWRELVLPDSLVRMRICSTLVLLTRTPWHRDSVCVRVNIPEFLMDFLEDGHRIRQYRVVVGRDTVGRFTPPLSSQIKHVVINPQWHVPTKILHNEIMAGKEMNAKSLRDQGYEPKFNADGKVVGAYQPSGDDNALGKVKFLFDNRFGVYIHDTPSRYLFARRTRAYSHGCVRLDNPLDFAAFLLGRDGHRLAQDLDSLVEEEDQKWLKLTRPMPVHFEYRLVTVDAQGRVRFLRDLYALARERAKLEKERLKREAKALSAAKGCLPKAPSKSLPKTGTTER
ncbi:MAG: hypothetical protein RL318_2211 [Fibrobacterota bacterium]|jgi:hypothetical protein